MTERRHYRFSALWVLAPVTAGVLGLSADWAIQHNPLESTAAAAPTPTPTEPSASTPRTRALEARLENVTARYEARRQALIDAQRSLREGAQRLAALRSAAPQSSGTSGGSAPAAVQAPAAPPPAAAPPAPPAAPVAPPAPPPVDTSTGAS